jgi:lipopolysaccharide export system permease protein
LSNRTFGSVPVAPKKLQPDLLSNFNRAEQLEILKIASNSIVNSNYTIDASKMELENKQKVINSHWIALYDKFVIAFACLLMFFIGAPLGAIIRKGGLGLPIVFAVLIFIIYHFINTFSKKVAQQDELSPFLGCWMSSLILSPLAILLTYRATNDIGLINMDVVLLPFQKLYKKIFPTQN